MRSELAHPPGHEDAEQAEADDGEEEAGHCGLGRGSGTEDPLAIFSSSTHLSRAASITHSEDRPASTQLSSVLYVPTRCQ